MFQLWQNTLCHVERESASLTASQTHSARSEIGSSSTLAAPRDDFWGLVTLSAVSGRKAGIGFVLGRPIARRQSGNSDQCRTASKRKIKMLHSNVREESGLWSKYASRIYTSIFNQPQPAFQNKPLARTFKESDYRKRKILMKGEVGKKSHPAPNSCLWTVFI